MVVSIESRRPRSEGFSLAFGTLSPGDDDDDDPGKGPEVSLGLDGDGVVESPDSVEEGGLFEEFEFMNRSPIRRGESLVQSEVLYRGIRLLENSEDDMGGREA